MSLTLAITLNTILDLGILSALAYVMTRPSALIPHRPAGQAELSLAAADVRRSTVPVEGERERVAA